MPKKVKPPKPPSRDDKQRTKRAEKVAVLVNDHKKLVRAVQKSADKMARYATDAGLKKLCALAETSDGRIKAADVLPHVV